MREELRRKEEELRLERERVAELLCRLKETSVKAEVAREKEEKAEREAKACRD